MSEEELAQDHKIIELSGEQRFPVAAALVKMDAYSLAKTQIGKDGYSFSIDRELLCERLRQLATLIEENKILPQNVAFTSKAAIQDFTLTTMEFTFAEKGLG